MLTFASIVEKWFIARYAILRVKKFSVLRLSLLDTALGNNIKTCWGILIFFFSVGASDEECKKPDSLARVQIPPPVSKKSGKGQFTDAPFPNF